MFFVTAKELIAKISSEFEDLLHEEAEVFLSLYSAKEHSSPTNWDASSQSLNANTIEWTFCCISYLWIPCLERRLGVYLFHAWNYWNSLKTSNAAITCHNRVWSVARTFYRCLHLLTSHTHTHTHIYIYRWLSRHVPFLAQIWVVYLFEVNITSG